MPRRVAGFRKPTLQENIQTLANYRQDNVRDSAKICELGESILEAKGGLSSMKDDVWAFLEQLAIAALDSGKLDLAKVGT